MDRTGGATVSELESELKERLTRFINGDGELEEFQDWFVPTFWDESDLDSTAVRLAHEVELVISEYTSGAWPLEEARALLGGLLGTPVVEAQWWGGFPRLVTGTTSRLIRSSRVPEGQEASAPAPAGIRYAVARG
jgi:hypothetical protein